VILYFLRHGIAESTSPSGDSHRRLTAQGEEQLRRVLTLAHLRPALILTSPYLRAMETAGIAQSLLAETAPLVASKALVPDSSPHALWEEVRTLGERSILIVAHEPLISSTIAWMLGSTRTMIRVPPSGLIALETASNGPVPVAELRWMIVPDVAC
jgi:phosphohistidine phosphatase